MSESGSNISLATEDSNPKRSNANNKTYDLHSTHHNYESAEELVLAESFINNKWRFLKNDPGKKTHQCCSLLIISQII